MARLWRRPEFHSRRTVRFCKSKHIYARKQVDKSGFSSAVPSAAVMVTCDPTEDWQHNSLLINLFTKLVRFAVVVPLEAVALACARNLLYVESTMRVGFAVDFSVGVPQLACSSSPCLI